MLLLEVHTISILPDVLEDTVGERGSLHVGEEVLVTLVRDTEEVNKIIHHRRELRRMWNISKGCATRYRDQPDSESGFRVTIAEE